MTSFRELGLSEAVIKSIAEMGFEEPTPVQAETIPTLLGGRDVVAQALTGTGKTAAFGIPLVERVDPARFVPQAVVLAPTRELVVQVATQLSGIGRERGLHVLPIYGGQPIERQLRALQRGVHVIIATPGRLMDHMRRGTVDLSAVMMFVLDEADVMLDMGFIDDIQFVLSHIPTERATALFSATMPEPILALAKRYMREPTIIQLSRPKALTVPEIDQVYYEVPFLRKFDALCRVLDVKRPDRALVFCATKRMVDQIVEGLQGRGYLAEGLHGDMSQVARDKALLAFRSGRIEALVATDVAARGLDIPEVSLVVNFDLPPDADYYVHRIGRTGRLGRKGEAITFVNPREMRELREIERATGARIRREQVPSGAEVESREAEVLEERLTAALAGERFGKYRGVIENLLEDHDAIDVAAAALSIAAERGGRARSTTSERPSAEPMADFGFAPRPAPGHLRPPAPGPRRYPERSAGPAPTERPAPGYPRPPAGSGQGYPGKPVEPESPERPAPGYPRPPFAGGRRYPERPAGPESGERPAHGQPRPPFTGGRRYPERPAGTEGTHAPWSHGPRRKRPF